VVTVAIATQKERDATFLSNPSFKIRGYTANGVLIVVVAANRGRNVAGKVAGKF
jgi:hypothetical protein